MAITLSSKALVTLADVKGYLGLRETSGDEQLLTLINAISLQAQNGIIRRDLESVERTEYYDGDGTNVLVLKHYPVTDISSFVAFTGGGELTVDDDYVLLADRGIIKLKYLLFPRSYQEIAITYTAGYEDADSDGALDVPWDLKQSIIEAVALRKRQKDKKWIGLRSQSRGDNSAEYSLATFPTQITDVWKRYRRKR
jgi:uncharacterized phiE125 gp8 family phage protein